MHIFVPTAVLLPVLPVMPLLKFRVGLANAIDNKK
jgi:hypothetical protein